MGVFDKFQEKVKICYQIVAKNCQFLQNIYTWLDIIQGPWLANTLILSICAYLFCVVEVKYCVCSLLNYWVAWVQDSIGVRSLHSNLFIWQNVIVGSGYKSYLIYLFVNKMFFVVQKKLRVIKWQKLFHCGNNYGYMIFNSMLLILLLSRYGDVPLAVLILLIEMILLIGQHSAPETEGMSLLSCTC